MLNKNIIGIVACNAFEMYRELYSRKDMSDAP